MENRINIAELLKDCPKGMELDCTIFDNNATMYLKEVLTNDFAYPIVVTVKHNNLEYTKALTKHGSFNDLPYCNCVIFPKGKTTWEGFIPPYWIHGDIYSIGRCCENELIPVSNKFDITTLKPFESRVLVRDSNREKWKSNFWGFYDSDRAMKYPYACCGDEFAQCIPYEGNEHLLGTIKDCDEYYKTW